VAPGQSATVDLPAWPTVDDPDGAVETWLHVRAELAEAAPWAPAGHVVARAQHDLTVATAAAVSATPKPGPLRPVSAGASLTLGSAEFDSRTGRLTRLYGVPVAGPQLELFRGPTDNDRSDTRGSYELTGAEAVLGDGVPGPSSATRWRDRGLDRLVHRVLEVAAGDADLLTRVRVSAANSGLSVDVAYRWRLDPAEPDALTLLVDVVPSPGWDCTWPRVGVRFDVPPDAVRAQWFGTGPHESYPDTRRAARVGRFAADVDELNVTYSRPQETGHRAELRTLEVSDDARPVLRLSTVPDIRGHRPGFTLTRHTPQQLDRAGHPYELPENDTAFLYVDAAVHGVGSRACGIDVLPQHALWPGAHSIALRFHDPAGQPAASPDRS
jgi:beta-galactosidase